MSARVSSLPLKCHPGNDTEFTLVPLRELILSDDDDDDNGNHRYP